VSERLTRWSDRLDRWAGSAGRWAGAHWLRLLACAVGVGVLLALLAPVCAALGLESVARPIYAIYGIFCHQIPERTFWLAGHPMAFCARDTGLYGGLWLGMAVFSIWRRPRLSGRLACILAIPLILDGGSQLVGLRESVNWLRLTTGLLAGASAAWYLLPRLAASITSAPASEHSVAGYDVESSPSGGIARGRE
jgi:uncharacterized membrane protein